VQPSKLAIDNDGDTFGHTFAMMMQTKKELQDQVAQKTGMGPVSPKLVIYFYHSVCTNDASQD
jgi:hypothetical protein